MLLDKLKLSFARLPLRLVSGQSTVRSRGKGRTDVQLTISSHLLLTIITTSIMAATSIAAQQDELTRIDDEQHEAPEGYHSGEGYDDEDEDEDSLDEEEVEALRAMAVDDADWDLARGGEWSKLLRQCCSPLPA